jgi:excisionase family DNA binding protein
MATQSLTTREAARRLKCSVPIVRKAIAQGTLRAIRVGARVVRIPEHALDRVGRNGKITKRRRRRP